MDREEALRLLRGDEDGIEEWNRLREEGEEIPSLNGADLIDADLSRANLSRANLSHADLSNAVLHDAKLRLANLSEADLSGANLMFANLNSVSCARTRTRLTGSSSSQRSATKQPRMVLPVPVAWRTITPGDPIRHFRNTSSIPST